MLSAAVVIGGLRAIKSHKKLTTINEIKINCQHYFIISVFAIYNSLKRICKFSLHFSHFYLVNSIIIISSGVKVIQYFFTFKWSH